MYKHFPRLWRDVVVTVPTLREVGVRMKVGNETGDSELPYLHFLLKCLCTGFV